MNHRGQLVVDSPAEVARKVVNLGLFGKMLGVDRFYLIINFGITWLFSLT